MIAAFSSGNIQKLLDFLQFHCMKFPSVPSGLWHFKNITPSRDSEIRGGDFQSYFKTIYCEEISAKGEVQENCFQ